MAKLDMSKSAKQKRRAASMKEQHEMRSVRGGILGAGVPELGASGSAAYRRSQAAKGSKR